MYLFLNVFLKYKMFAFICVSTESEIFILSNEE